eukprot:12876132-Alexandrium_andersonii.AAC.1
MLARAVRGPGRRAVVPACPKLILLRAPLAAEPCLAVAAKTGAAEVDGRGSPKARGVGPCGRRGSVEACCRHARQLASPAGGAP